MDFRERIYALAARVAELREHTCSEEATKNALILPFLHALGYDTSDPRIVEPEFTADVGTKKGEKVDYAIKRDGLPIMLIEAKCCGSPLDQGKANQLLRYFHTTKSARIGILTDGVVYQFFSDLDQPNVMDSNPFMTFDFSAIEDALIPELKKLANDRFDIEATLAAAQDLKHIRQLKGLLAKELRDPSDELVRYFARDVHKGHFRSNIIECFREKLRLAFQHHINDTINDRLQTAMQDNAYPEPTEQDTNESTPDIERQHVTTQDEWEAYFAVKSILREVIRPERITMRDAQSYCAILLDNNNRKPICRLHFNGKNKCVGLFDENKKETRHPVDGADGLYNFSDALREGLKRYENS